MWWWALARPDTGNNGEVALDIEMAIAMAPDLSRVIVYEEKSVSTSVLSRIATDNLAKQVSSSWMVGSWSSSLAAQFDTISEHGGARPVVFSILRRQRRLHRLPAFGQWNHRAGGQPLRHHCGRNILDDEQHPARRGLQKRSGITTASAALPTGVPAAASALITRSLTGRPMSAWRPTAVRPPTATLPTWR